MNLAASCTNSSNSSSPDPSASTSLMMSASISSSSWCPSMLRIVPIYGSGEDFPPWDSLSHFTLSFVDHSPWSCRCILSSPGRMRRRHSSELWKKMENPWLRGRSQKWLKDFSEGKIAFLKRKFMSQVEIKEFLAIKLCQKSKAVASENLKINSQMIVNPIYDQITFSILQLQKVLLGWSLWNISCKRCFYGFQIAFIIASEHGKITEKLFLAAAVRCRERYFSKLCQCIVREQLHNYFLR